MGAAAVVVYELRKMPRLRQMRLTPGLVALTGLLIACSDLFLVSQRLSLQNGAGGNLLSIRDLFLVLVFACSFSHIASADKRYLLGNSLSMVSIVWALYSLCLALIGYAHGNATRDIVFELIVVWGGLVGVSVLAIIKSEADARFVGNVFTILGILIAIGVVAEVYLRVPIVTGSSTRATITASSKMVRPTPAGWVFLTSSTAFLLARILFDKQARGGKKWLMVVLVALELTAGMLTQTRSIQVAVVVVFLSLCYLRRVRGLVLGAILVGLGAAAWIVALAVGNRVIDPQFAARMGARYSVFDNRDASQTYYKDELRPMQVRALFTGLGPWAVWGSGLGDDISQVNLEMPAGASYTDVSLVYLATRFGLIGDIVFVVFVWFAFRSLSRIRSDTGAVSWVRAGFAATLCGLIIISLSTDVWEATYSAIPTTIAYFVVLALNRCVGRRIRLVVTRPPLYRLPNERQIQCSP